LTLLDLVLFRNIRQKNSKRIHDTINDETYNEASDENDPSIAAVLWDGLPLDSLALELFFSHSENPLLKKGKQQLIQKY
jgi:hypothetical protein